MRSFRSIQAGVFALAALLAVVAGLQRVSADVRLASVFGNHMVLQREQIGRAHV